MLILNVHAMGQDLNRGGLLIEAKCINHNWDMTKWSLNGGGLLIEAKCINHNWDMTKWSLNRGSLWIQMVTIATNCVNTEVCFTGSQFVLLITD